MRNERFKPVQSEMPLSDEGAERAVVGICLAHPQAYWDVQGRVDTRHFTTPRLARIWEAMATLARDGKPVTREMVPLAIRNDGGSDLGLPQFLATLLVDVPSPSFILEFADSIIHLAGRRSLLEALDRAKADVMVADLGTPIESVVEATIGSLATAASNAFDRHMRSYGEWASEVCDRSMRSFERGESEALGFSSGLRAVDEVWGRLLPGRLYVLAGISSAGKSALARQIIEHVAAEAAAKKAGWAYVASLEMSGEESATRALAQQMGISSSAIDEGSLGYGDLDAMAAARDRLRSLPIMLDTKPRMRMSDMRSRMIRLKNQKGLAAAVLDHLLLVKPDGRADSLLDRVSEATIEGKILARELEIPVIILAQLNEKTVLERPSGKPNTIDLFGGQTIKQNADAIGFIHRPETVIAKKEPAKGDEEKHARWAQALANSRGKAEFFSDKRRGGVSGELRYLNFDGPTMTFKDV